MHLCVNAFLRLGRKYDFEKLLHQAVTELSFSLPQKDNGIFGLTTGD